MLRSGDKTFSFKEVKQGRKLDPDVKKTREQTDEKSSKWLQRIFFDVHPDGKK